MEVARKQQTKRQEAAHKELMKNLQKVQEKIEDLAHGNLLNDEAFRQLSITNKELYTSLKRMVEGLNHLHIVYEETIMESRMVNKWKNPDAAKNRCEIRQAKQNKENTIRCPCGEFISDSYIDQHQKNQCHQDAMLRINIDKNQILKSMSVDKLLTINAHLNALKHNRKMFRYAPKCWWETQKSVNVVGKQIATIRLHPRRYNGNLIEGQYPPMYLLEQWIKRFRIKSMGHGARYLHMLAYAQ